MSQPPEDGTPERFGEKRGSVRNVAPNSALLLIAATAPNPVLKDFEMTDVDVVVVGAGLAGLSAARNLAEVGKTAVVIT